MDSKLWVGIEKKIKYWYRVGSQCQKQQHNSATLGETVPFKVVLNIYRPYTQGLLYIRTDFLPKEIAKTRPRIDKTILHYHSNWDIKFYQIRQNYFEHLSCTSYLNSFWILNRYNEVQNFHYNTWYLAIPLLFLLKSVFGLILGSLKMTCGSQHVIICMPEKSYINFIKSQ